jgi:regulator of protease activity HflC (stomatin/prohibitin superfamily)
VSRVDAVVDELTGETTKPLTATTSLEAVLEKALKLTASRVKLEAVEPCTPVLELSSWSWSAERATAVVTVSRVDAVVDELTGETTKPLTATTSLEAVLEKALKATASRVELVAVEPSAAVLSVDAVVDELTGETTKPPTATTSLEAVLEKALRATASRVELVAVEPSAAVLRATASRIEGVVEKHCTPVLELSSRSWSAERATAAVPVAGEGRSRAIKATRLAEAGEVVSTGRGGISCKVGDTHDKKIK